MRRLQERVGVASVLLLTLAMLPGHAAEEDAIRFVKSFDDGRVQFRTAGGSDGSLYFWHIDESYDYNLWRTDGTPRGTISLGTFSQTLYELLTMFAVGDTVYFVGATPETGPELWKTDGTPEGTVLVKDIFPGPYSRWLLHPWPSFTEVNGTLFFLATTDWARLNLWKSDGTEAGTVSVSTAVHPYPGAYPQVGVGIGNWLLFTSYYENPRGLFLWRTDGTPGGTVLVSADFPLDRYVYPNDMTRIGDVVFFGAISGESVWVTDGTSEGTHILQEFPSRRGVGTFTPLGDSVFFWVSSDTGGIELWRTDGTAQGTDLALDGLSPGWDLSSAGKTLFFPNEDDAHGIELWGSDGTPEGTALLEDVNPGSASSDPSCFVQARDVLLFIAEEEDGRFRLWKSDGTSAGTIRVDRTKMNWREKPTCVQTKTRLYFIRSARDDSAVWMGRLAILAGRPGDAILDLMLDVEAAKLNHLSEQSLLTRLRAAADAYEAHGAGAVTESRLRAFIDEVELQRGSKIADEIADQFIDFANEIIDLL